MEDFFDPTSNELCAICGEVWDGEDIQKRAKDGDEEALLILSQQGCPACVRGEQVLRERLIAAGLIQREQIGTFADETMDRFFQPAYYEVMQQFFQEAGQPLCRVRTIDEMLSWARSHPANEIAGDASAAEYGVLPRCHDQLDDLWPDAWRFLHGFVDYGINRRRMPYTPEILRIQQILDAWAHYTIQEHVHVSTPVPSGLTYGQFIILLSYVQREAQGEIQQEIDGLLTFSKVQAWLLAQPVGAIVGTASRAWTARDERHARNALAWFLRAQLGVVVSINWEGIRVGSLDADTPCYALPDFCFRYLQLLDCLAAGSALTEEREVRREVALALWERLKEIL
jgi:hypothetical protein